MVIFVVATVDLVPTQYQMLSSNAFLLLLLILFEEYFIIPNSQMRKLKFKSINLLKAMQLVNNRF